ncbi:hypothetical protein [Phocaeicola sp.]
MEQRTIMPSFQFLPRKYSPVPCGLSKAALRAGWQEKIILASSGIFSSQALHNPGTEQPGRQENEILAPRSRSCLILKIKKMTETKENKASEGLVADLKVKLDTISYRGKTYPTREVSNGLGSYTVSVIELNEELLDGMRSSDPFAFEIDERIYFFCTWDEIRTLSDEKILAMVD